MQEVTVALISGAALVLSGWLARRSAGSASTAIKAAGAAASAASSAESAADCLDAEAARRIVEQLEQLLRGLEQHRRETARDFGGIREEIRTDRRRLDRIQETLFDHVNNTNRR